MPSFRVGAYECEGGQETAELLAALRETDERLQLTSSWRSIRAVTEKRIESGDFSLQGLSAGQFSAFATAILFRMITDEDGTLRVNPAIGGGIGELLLNPRPSLEEFERQFLESHGDDSGRIDERNVALFFKDFYFHLSGIAGE
jgi:hypothetical protein